MRSTTTNRCLAEETDNPPDALEHICMAADLLQGMFCALRSLAKNQPELARAMSTREYLIWRRLWTLRGAVDLLLSIENTLEIIPLMRRATALISWLSSETDELARHAAGDGEPMRAGKTVIH